MRKILLLIIPLLFCAFLPRENANKITITSNYLNAFNSLVDPSAFPGAEGFGMQVTGGRGGQIIYVTNLNDSGTGSLRAAVEASGTRTVMFKVSGIIELTKDLKITNGNITIAGQSAPGDGICLKNYSVTVDADNVIIRFMRFRMGDEAQHEGDALGGRFHNNIIIDHCSMSWSTDECVSFYNNQNSTVQWCIISESLRNSVHGKGAHGYGGIWGGKNASFHHNLLAHHDSRNARFGETAGSAFALTDLVDFRNNVIYNWGHNSSYGGEAMNINLINNYYKPGPATLANNGTTKEGRIISIDKNKVKGTAVYDTWGKFYIDGNYVHGHPNPTNDNWTYGVYNQFHSTYNTYPSSCKDSGGNTIICEYTIPISESDKTMMKLNVPHNVQGNVSTHSATEAYAKVLAYGGASLVRDAIDVRIVTETENGTYTYNGSNGSSNGIIDTQTDVGGWPVYNSTIAPTDTDSDGMPDTWEDANGLNKNNASDGTSTSLDGGYTNVEVYLNHLVSSIISSQNKNSLSVGDNTIDNSLIKIYPVPFKNEFHIDFAKAGKVKQISVFNMLGQQIRLINANEIINKTTKVNINSGEGIYVIKIITDHGVINKTIVKE
ncbi:T9SS type A sorting domain-containing protein [Aestuariibaculum sediminum]|uniref:T9SS type A sorting domain-containing protein n=1 Tax=Aestuariibaculum sediminum TaxID=2770637 RepID=A0A8J6Q989_9FLAO|nr:T9SS type A sorting domain-containing protein [Aestuariibaculum sediminum]MBD0833390.1 T9SS type A sorting domain-containing protein [Aestuariibaculum sediminum]